MDLLPSRADSFLLMPGRDHAPLGWWLLAPLRHGLRSFGLYPVASVITLLPPCGSASQAYQNVWRQEIYQLQNQKRSGTVWSMAKTKGTWSVRSGLLGSDDQIELWVSDRHNDMTLAIAMLSPQDATRLAMTLLRHVQHSHEITARKR